MKIKIYLLICCSILHLNCSSDRIIFEEVIKTEEFNSDLPDDILEVEENNPNPQGNYKILALGDSYTIGQSVCQTCRFPEQLKSRLNANQIFKKDFDLKIIATTGWTTTNLLNAIETENLANNYNLATLLIGVNNQYQGKPFSLYENEFPKLVKLAISKVKDDKNKIIVISIPDYAFTPYGNGNTSISKEIDRYNTFAKVYCNAHDITYLNITDITRMGLQSPNLVASDGLHPSKLAYLKFVERILPLAIEKLK